MSRLEKCPGYHPERSEGSREPDDEILRCAQDDRQDTLSAAKDDRQDTLSAAKDDRQDTLSAAKA